MIPPPQKKTGRTLVVATGFCTDPGLAELSLVITGFERKARPPGFSGDRGSKKNHANSATLLMGCCKKTMESVVVLIRTIRSY